MKYTTTLGTEVEISPLGLKDRDAFLAIQNLQESFKDTPSWKERFKMHDDFCDLCRMRGIDPDAVGEGDIVNVISILMNGETPKNSPTP